MECLTIWVLINWLLTLNTFYSLSCWTKNSQHFWVSKVVLIKSHVYTTFINELSLLLATNLVQGSAYFRVRCIIHWQGDSGSRGSLGSLSTSRQNVCGRERAKILRGQDESMNTLWEEATEKLACSAYQLCPWWVSDIWDMFLSHSMERFVSFVVYGIRISRFMQVLTLWQYLW